MTTKIFGESICIAFWQGVRDRKMAEKMATWVITSPTQLFTLTDKCASTAEARERQASHPDRKEAKASDIQEETTPGLCRACRCGGA